MSGGWKINNFKSLGFFSAFLGVLLLLSFLVTPPAVGASYTENISTVITDSEWAVAQGDNFGVNVMVINNENSPENNVEVYAYVFENGTVLNEGGWEANKITGDLPATGSGRARLPIDLKDNVDPGVYKLRARTKLSNNAKNDATQSIQVFSSGVHLKIGRWNHIVNAGAGTPVSTSILNDSEALVDNAQIYSHVYKEDNVVSENGWKGNKKNLSIAPEEIENVHFDINIRENIDLGNYSLRTKLKLENRMWIQKEREDFMEGEAENVDLQSSIDNIKLKLKDIAYHPVISEVYPDGANEDSEFVELYNPTTRDENLANWTLKEESGNSTTFDSSSVIPAHGFYLIGFSGGAKDNSTWSDADIVTDWSLSNSGEYITLTDSSGRMVDNFAYGDDASFGEGGGFTELIGEENSAERKSGSVHSSSKGNGYDTENNSEDFFEQNSPNPENSSSSIEIPPQKYYLNGLYFSDVFDAGGTAEWRKILWKANTPTDTSLKVKTRTSGDNKNWSAWEAVDNGSIIQSPDNRYIQYRIDFNTLDNDKTPVLNETDIGYSLSRTIIKEENIQIIPSIFGGLSEESSAIENGFLPSTHALMDNIEVWGKDNQAVINEIFPNVKGSDSGNEWVEIYNTSQDNKGWEGIDISEWKLRDDDENLASVPKNTILRPDEYYVFRSLSGLSNTGENIQIVTDNGEKVAKVEYTSSKEGLSIARVPNGTGSWDDNVLPTKGRNNDDNSEGAAYSRAIGLENIRTLAKDYRQSLIDNAKSKILSRAEIVEALRYLRNNAGRISSEDAGEVTRHIKSNGGFVENIKQDLENYGYTENQISAIENTVLENPDEMADSMPHYGLGLSKIIARDAARDFVDSASALLRLEAATYIENDFSSFDLSGKEYMDALKENWQTVLTRLGQAKKFDNRLYRALAAENFERSHREAKKLMDFAENQTLLIPENIRLARRARRYYRDNGTSENIRQVAGYEHNFDRALDRFLYYYQKGLYFRMVTLGALNGDNADALAEASEARSMPLTVDVGPQTWENRAPAPRTANFTAKIVENNGDPQIYIGGMYQHHLDQYDVKSDSWSTTSSFSENAWGWDAGSALAYAEDNGKDYIYGLMGGDTREFYRYNLGTGTWENMGYTPSIVSAGGSLVWTGENVLYATKGKNSAGFWLYNIENNSWDNSTLAQAPGGLGSGAGLEWNENDFLYTFKGEGSDSFYRYSISSNSWSAVPDAPASVGAGGSLSWTFDNLWAVRGGGTTGFWKYDPSAQVWENSVPTPATVGTRSGQKLVSYRNYLYLPRGEGDNQFWRFVVERPQVTVEKLLANPKAYDNEGIWVEGFASNVRQKYGVGDHPYSLFDLTTFEGRGAEADNDSYFKGENVDASQSDNLKLGHISAGSNVVISEVYPDPVVSYDRTEYVELYNPTSTEISLEGYVLYEESVEKITFGPNAEILPHGYYLIADDDYPDYKDDENVSWPEPDNTVPWGLSNSGDSVTLRDDDGIVIDQFGYESNENYEGSIYPSTPPEGSSAERYSSSAQDPSEDQGNAYDTDNNANDFFEQSSPNPENSEYSEDPPAGGYAPSGYLESSIYDAGVTVEWENIKWRTQLPQGTGLMVEVRTGGSSKIDNSWTSWRKMDNGQAIGENARYAQYQVELSTDNDSRTPLFKEIDICYTAGGETQRWLQSDWSGGSGREIWSAQQKLEVYYTWGHIGVGQGIGENSYAKVYGIFHASSEKTGDPRLSARRTDLSENGAPIPSSSPDSWQTYEPWSSPSYLDLPATSWWYSNSKFMREEEGAIEVAYELFGDSLAEFSSHYMKREKYTAVQTLIHRHDLSWDVIHNSYDGGSGFGGASGYTPGYGSGTVGYTTNSPSVGAPVMDMGAIAYSVGAAC